MASRPSERNLRGRASPSPALACACRSITGVLGRTSEARWKIVGGWDARRSLGRRAEGNRELLVGIERESARIALVEFTVHIYLEHIRAVSTVAPDTVFREEHAPNVEELTEREGGLEGRLDVNDSGRIVRVDSREPLLCRMDTDVCRHDYRHTMDKDIEMLMDVKHLSFHRLPLHGVCGETSGKVRCLDRPGRVRLLRASRGDREGCGCNPGKCARVG